MEELCYAAYVKEISKYPLLTAEQERDLSKKIKNGDESAKHALVNANLRLVVAIAVKSLRNKVSLMDNIQEGNMGLLVAASKYDYSFETRFSTYAYTWIVQYIGRYANLKQPSILLPALKLEKLRTINAGIDELVHKLGRSPTMQEISIYVGLSEKVVRKLKSYDYKTVSIDSPIDSEGRRSFVDFLCDENANPERDVLQEFERKEYEYLISQLSDRECSVMMKRYDSFTNREKTSFHRMGSELGLSIEAIRQIEIRARLKLRPAIEAYSAQFA